jgi:hypothetical protein
MPITGGHKSSKRFGAKVVARADPDSSTDQRGQLLESWRGSRAFPPGNVGRAGRNASQHPSMWNQPGAEDYMNANDMDGDFDAGPFED